MRKNTIVTYVNFIEHLCKTAGYIQEKYIIFKLQISKPDLKSVNNLDI